MLGTVIIYLAQVHTKNFYMNISIYSKIYLF